MEVKKKSEGHQEPASTLAGTSAAEERDVPAEVLLSADLPIILTQPGDMEGRGWRGEDTEGFHCEADAPRALRYGRG